VAQEPLLPAEEADLAVEESRIPPVRDHNLELAVGVTADPADDAELEQEELHVSRELRAVGGVGDLDAHPRQS
jgi:hypothetical protein